MKTFLMVITALLFLVSTSYACTIQWSAVTTYTNGIIVPEGVLVRYKLYFQPVGATTSQVVADTEQLSVTLLCPAGKYWATAYTANDLESAQSNIVELNQLSPPVILQWSN